MFCLGVDFGLSDPLDIIPEDYSSSNYEDDYDINDVPEDQAAPENLAGRSGCKTKKTNS